VTVSLLPVTAVGVDCVGVATATVAAGAGNAAAGGVEAGALAALRAGGDPNSEGWPVCLFQASQSSTSDIVKTTHKSVRRISVM